jgi:hypothetical protein
LTAIMDIIFSEPTLNKELLEHLVKPKAFVHIRFAFLFQFLVLGNLDLLLYALDLGLLLAEILEGLV